MGREDIDVEASGSHIKNGGVSPTLNSFYLKKRFVGILMERRQTALSTTLVAWPESEGRLAVL
jgi:hypothetical protein